MLCKLVEGWELFPGYEWLAECAGKLIAFFYSSLFQTSTKRILHHVLNTNAHLQEGILESNPNARTHLDDSKIWRALHHLHEVVTA